MTKKMNFIWQLCFANQWISQDISSLSSQSERAKWIFTGLVITYCTYCFLRWHCCCCRCVVVVVVVAVFFFSPYNKSGSKFKVKLHVFHIWLTPPTTEETPSFLVLMELRCSIATSYGTHSTWDLRLSRRNAPVTSHISGVRRHGLPTPRPRETGLEQLVGMRGRTMIGVC